LKPACWIGGVVENIQKGSADLVLDGKWLQLAGVKGPLVLKTVYFADLETSFPVDSLAEIQSIKVKNSVFITATAYQHKVVITKEMRFGKNPLPPRNSTSSAALNLLLLPGYCANVNPWTRKQNNFHNGFYPVDKGNHANDHYTNKILAQVENQNMESFGVIGHSQGGMVALHMHNFYWTGLANANGPRLIQTVGTPFQGSTAAGSAAKLGEIFGIGCGSNTDLSRDGAVNWLAGISNEARQDVHFYTTTYQQGNFFGDWCSLPMNLILQWPNDGVVELVWAKLPGGVSMGNKEKWCHTTDMGYAPQYDDTGRNAEMNQNAAR